MGEAFVTATPAEPRWKIRLCCTCYLMVLYVKKATENVNARMYILRDKVSSALAFFQARNARVVSQAHCNPLRVRWLHLQLEKIYCH